MISLLLILAALWPQFEAVPSYTVPGPQQPYSAAAPTSGAAIFHFKQPDDLKHVAYQAFPLDDTAGPFSLPDVSDSLKTASGDANPSKRHSVAFITPLPHKDANSSKGQRVPFVPDEPELPPGSTLRKAPLWIEHIPTKSKHKFTINNLGQSQLVMEQFYKGSNGGKPYVTPSPDEEVTSTEKVKVNSRETKEIVEKIIKQELNRAKVAKFGKSAGGGYNIQISQTIFQENVSGGSASRPTVEQSGYSGENRAIIDWSENNNKLDEFPNGYDGLSALPEPNVPNSVLTNRIIEELTTIQPPTAYSITPPYAPPTTRIFTTMTSTTPPYVFLSTPYHCGTSDSAAAGPTASSQANTPRTVEYPLPKSVDGSVTGHMNGCVPCSESANAPAPPATLAPMIPLPSLPKESPVAPPSLPNHTPLNPAPYEQPSTHPGSVPNAIPPAPVPAPTPSENIAPPPQSTSAKAIEVGAATMPAPGEREYSQQSHESPAPAPSSPPLPPPDSSLPAVALPPSEPVALPSPAPTELIASEPAPSVPDPASAIEGGNGSEAVANGYEKTEPAPALIPTPAVEPVPAPPPVVGPAPAPTPAVESALTSAQTVGTAAPSTPAVEPASGPTPAVEPALGPAPVSEPAPLPTPVETVPLPEPPAPQVELPLPSVSAPEPAAVVVKPYSEKVGTAPSPTDPAPASAEPVDAGNTIEQLPPLAPAPSPSEELSPVAPVEHVSAPVEPQPAPTSIQTTQVVIPVEQPAPPAPKDKEYESVETDSASIPPLLNPAPAVSGTIPASSGYSNRDASPSPPPPAPSPPQTAAPAPSSSYEKPQTPSSSYEKPPTSQPLEPASVSVPEKTAPAFVQTSSTSAESSYSNLEGDHSEAEVPRVPVPVPAPAYKEVEPSPEPSANIESIESGSEVAPPSPSGSLQSSGGYESSSSNSAATASSNVNSGSSSSSSSYSSSAEVSAPQSTSGDSYKSGSVGSESAAPSAPSSPEEPINNAQYINESPKGSNEQSYKETSDKVSYVPEASPSLPEVPEESPPQEPPQESIPGHPAESSYTNLEEDHVENKGPVTIIDTENNNVPASG
ncbi:hypothetical protein RB195_003129 [Necator americanus]|uniref:Uncharacterized protein n=1 Tax=Necator americanus TaxID=51031 RepID=A0ABR1DPZ1_NECAM